MSIIYENEKTSSQKDVDSLKILETFLKDVASALTENILTSTILHNFKMSKQAMFWIIIYFLEHVIVIKSNVECIST